MENVIIFAIIAAVAVFAFYRTVKYFKKPNGCCGGGDYKPKRKHLSNIIRKTVFSVDGMHCEHCKNRVEEAVNDIDGVMGVVSLKKDLLSVSYTKDVDSSVIIEKIKKAGYTAKEQKPI